MKNYAKFQDSEPLYVISTDTVQLDLLEVPFEYEDISEIHLNSGGVTKRPKKPAEFYKWYLNTWVIDLDQLKDIKWNTVKSKRQQIEDGGFVWNNYTFDSNLTSQSRIQGACQLALMDTANFTIDWTLQNNLVLTLSGTDMLQVGIAMGQHINSTHIHARNLRTDIYACTTKEQLELIGDW